MHRTKHWACCASGPCAIHRRAVNGCGVYFMGWNDWVKVGYATDIRKRFLSLAGAVPVGRVRVIAFIPMTSPTAMMLRESELHEAFAAYRVRGEWFQDNAVLREYIAQHAQLWPEAA